MKRESSIRRNGITKCSCCEKYIQVDDIFSFVDLSLCSNPTKINSICESCINKILNYNLLIISSYGTCQMINDFKKTYSQS